MPREIYRNETLVLAESPPPYIGAPGVKVVIGNEQSTAHRSKFLTDREAGELFEALGYYLGRSAEVAA